jgi:hypothetical protein
VGTIGGGGGEEEEEGVEVGKIGISFEEGEMFRLFI